MSSGNSNSLLSGLKTKLSRKSSRSPTTPTFKTPLELSLERMSQQSQYGIASPATRRPEPRSRQAAHDPPPAYTPKSTAAPTASSVAHSPVSPVVAVADDRYAFLASFDTVFLIDDSGSMAGRSWRETAGALETITPICTAHDADGIDLYFLNEPDKPSYRGIRDVRAVRDIFQAVRPQYGTPTGQRLNQILRPYLARCVQDLEGTKPLNVIVITDGEPSDDVESVIINAARKLDKLDAPAWQVGIQFFQVGREPGAREHLRQLDDELAELAGGDDLRDIVDTVPFTGQDDAPLTGEGILKVVLGAVNRRLDRRRSHELYRAEMP